MAIHLWNRRTGEHEIEGKVVYTLRQDRAQGEYNNTGNMGNTENRGKRERNRRHRLNRGPGEQRETEGIKGRGGMWGRERISEIERTLV